MDLSSPPLGDENIENSLFSPRRHRGTRKSFFDCAFSIESVDSMLSLLSFSVEAGVGLKSSCFLVPSGGSGWAPDSPNLPTTVSNSEKSQDGHDCGIPGFEKGPSTSSGQALGHPQDFSLPTFLRKTRVILAPEDVGQPPGRETGERTVCPRVFS